MGFWYLFKYDYGATFHKNNFAEAKNKNNLVILHCETLSFHNGILSTVYADICKQYFCHERA